MSVYPGRPFKVWNADRSSKKSLIAISLADLVDKAEKDMLLLGMLACTAMNTSEITAGKLCRQKKRQHQHTTYTVNFKIVCRDSFKFIYGISQNKLTALIKHFLEHGVTPRRKKSGGRRFNTNTIQPDDIERVVRFITNFAEDHGLVLPGRVPGFKRTDIKILPSAHTKASIWRHYHAIARARGCGKLGMPKKNVRVVLEADGTEVDEEDYFSFLNGDTVLMLLCSDDRWRPAGHEESADRDEPDAAVQGPELSQHVNQLLAFLKQDVTRIITFSDDDLQSMVDLGGPRLAIELKESEEYARAIKEACQRHLDERQRAKEAVDLLRLYHEARKISPYVDSGDGPPARKRPSSPPSGQL